MGAPTSSCMLGALLMICCFATVSLSYDSNHDNPIRLISDGLSSFQSTTFSIMDSILDQLSFTLFISPPIEAIYQFGDSISDTGNYVHDQPQSNYNQLPYGETYFHKPAGRGSDGLLMVDYFAKLLNLSLLDAYLNKDGNFTHGVNFAVMGAAALDNSTLTTKYNVQSTTTNHSLSEQLGWFKSHMSSVCSNASECRKKLANDLIMMGEIGGNDYNFVFFQGKAISIAYEMVPEVVRTIKSAIEEVIDLGATRIIVPGNFPVGCMTVFLAIFKSDDPTMYDELKCLKHLNKFARFHNDHLQNAIRELQKDHPNVAIVYGDYYSAFREILLQPTYMATICHQEVKSCQSVTNREFTSGFDEHTVHKACCGDGDNEYNFNFGRFCGNKGVPACKNPQEHVSWDGIHLTQNAYNVMAKWLMRSIFYGITKVA